MEWFAPKMKVSIVVLLSDFRTVLFGELSMKTSKSVNTSLSSVVAFMIISYCKENVLKQSPPFKTAAC